MNVFPLPINVFLVKEAPKEVHWVQEPPDVTYQQQAVSARPPACVGSAAWIESQGVGVCVQVGGLGVPLLRMLHLISEARPSCELYKS